VWDNFGPPHADRCDALSKALGSGVICGIELNERSRDYEWISDSRPSFKKVTLRPARHKVASAVTLFRAIRQERAGAVFFCHYERPEILLAALLTRLAGIAAFTMNDSKFDDYPRMLLREIGKRLFFLPYKGALVASRRSADYVRFLGIRADRIAHGYDSISVKRIRESSAAEPAPAGVGHCDRHFTIVARLIEKKNIKLALDAFALQRRAGAPDRRLVICGSGPLEGELKSQVADLGVSDRVEFRGFVQTAEVAATLATSLALILPSVEEQYGQVIAEAQAMGVPVLCSDNCGARDELVRTGVNGFVFEPDNAQGLAYFMECLSRDAALWTRMAEASAGFAAKADVNRFVEGVARLLALA
jgi:glycosyltransferase involved in cell wall biosynthesis